MHQNIGACISRLTDVATVNNLMPVESGDESPSINRTFTLPKGVFTFC
jgi:hypothetical protein